ncbi:MAG: alanine racemase, partial [Polyangia bacterium]|nr:alanine racemase [Polyangia bacterium]
MPSISLTLEDLARHSGGILRFAGAARAGDKADALSREAARERQGELTGETAGGTARDAMERAAAVRVRAVTVDSRRLVRPGTAFFALRGGQTDGHRFVAEAMGAGCVAAVVAGDMAEALLGSLPLGSPLVVLPPGGEEARRGGDARGAQADPVLGALGRLAAWWRGQLAATGKTRVLGITGSNGKTTVKSALGAVLGRRYRVSASPGSWNSRLGVALSLLAVEDDAEIALIEAGVSEPGDMAPLWEMIRPDLGLLTVIGTAHIGAFGDQDSIGREKLGLFRELGPEGWLLLPEDPRCERLGDELGLACPRVLFGPGAPDSAPVAVRRRSTTRALGQILRLRFPSREQYDLEVQDSSPAAVQNVAAAACAGVLLGVEPVEIADALGGFRPPPQRMETWQTPDGVTVINDCYSADPESTDAALRALGQYPAGRRRIFVFGGMAGLGSRSDEEHEHVGRLASRVGVSVLVAVGERVGSGPASSVFEGAVHRVASPQEATRVLAKILRHEDVVLLKGPTDQRLDGLARALLESTAPTRLMVSLSAVEANLRQLRRAMGQGVKLCPIVKAEAYGGDPVRLSRFLERAGVDALGVAFAEEGVALRKAGIGLPLLVLSPGRGDAERLVRHRLTPVIHSAYGLGELEEAAARVGRPVAVHLKVDTGMGRYGFFP